MHSAVRRNALCSKEKCVSRGLLSCNPLETHFSLLQSAFLLTAECISPYCIRSLKDPAHHIPNQTEIATEEFCPKSLLRKQNEIDFIESHFQILHHLKIVHKSYFLRLFQEFMLKETINKRKHTNSQQNLQNKSLCYCEISLAITSNTAS